MHPQYIYIEIISIYLSINPSTHLTSFMISHTFPFLVLTAPTKSP